MNDRPECYGILWEGLADRPCKGCQVQTGCLRVFALETLPAARSTYQQEHGELPTLEQLSELTQVHPDALLLAMQELDRHRAELAKAAEVEPEPQEEEAASEPEEPLTPEIPEDQLCPKCGEPLGPPNERGLYRCVNRHTWNAQELVSAPIEYEVEDAVEAAPDRPTEADSVPSVTGSASIPEEKSEEAAPPAKALADKRKPKRPRTKKKRVKRPKDEGYQPWGPHTFKERNQREKDRSPLIASLRPGTKLRREWHGVLYEVTIRKHGYWFNGQEYPTLYAVTKEITGTKSRPKQLDQEGDRPKGKRQVCNWSATRFWNLTGAASRFATQKEGDLLNPKPPKKAKKRTKPTRASKRKTRKGT